MDPRIRPMAFAFVLGKRSRVSQLWYGKRMSSESFVVAVHMSLKTSRSSLMFHTLKIAIHMHTTHAHEERRNSYQRASENE